MENPRQLRLLLRQGCDSSQLHLLTIALDQSLTATTLD